jgi:iron complex outermembrane receptor protein
MATRYESVDAPFVFDAPQNLHQTRFTAHDEWRMAPQYVLNAGAMWEDNGMGSRNISPRLALNYHMTSKHTFRTGFSVAYRNPAIAEESSNKRYVLGPILYQDWLSSGGLRPERVLSKEIGYVGNYGEGLSLDARVYNDKMTDVIWLDGIYMNVPGMLSIRNPTWDFRNELEVQYTGFEGTFKYKWDENNLTFNYAHQLVSAFLVGGSSETPAFTPFLLGYIGDFNKTVPLNTGSILLVSKISEGWSLGAGYYWQSAVQVLDGVVEQPISRRLDMRVARSFGPAVNHVGRSEVALVVQNALQSQIIGYSGYLFDRRAFVTFTINN